MKRDSIKTDHKKRNPCLECSKFFYPSEDGSVKVQIDRLVDKQAILKGLFCSVKCAVRWMTKKRTYE